MSASAILDPGPGSPKSQHCCWITRELDHQINAGLFERAVMSPTKVSAALRQLHPQAHQALKDVYTFDFLSLPEGHSEADLQRGLVANLKLFLLEFGRDFCFVGEAARWLRRWSPSIKPCCPTKRY